MADADLIRSGLDALDQGVTIFDADLTLVFANRGFLALRDIPRHLGEIGTRFEDQVRFRAARGDYGPGDPEDIVREHVELARQFKPHRIERTRADGLILEIRGDPLPGGGFIATYAEITERKRAEAALRQSEHMLKDRSADLEFAKVIYEEQGAKTAALAEALAVARQEEEIANRAKSEFLANMSHELRTPLNAIIGFSEIIGDATMAPPGSDKNREYINDINESAHLLLSLINDILDLSKVESGTDELFDRDIAVPEIVRSVLKLVGQRAGRGGITLESELSDRLPMLRADQRKLKQILVNLLSNAIKFTEAGGKVTLRARCPAGGGHVFRIIDTGIGMAPEDIPKALSQFGQVNRRHHLQRGGTGLGLPLTKALVELHGGSLDLQSEVGVGTTVTVQLPAERARELPAAKRPTADEMKMAN